MRTSIGVDSLGSVFIGEATVQHNIFDFPSFTLIEYSNNNNPSRPLGSLVTIDNLVFTADEISVNYLPRHIVEEVKRNSSLDVDYAITYTGEHITKRIAEFPVNVREMVQSRTFPKSGRNYIISLRDITEFAIQRSGYSARINFNADDANFTIPSTAEGDEYLLLSSFLTDLRHLRNYYYSFSGSSMTFLPLSNRSSLSYIPVGQYTLNKSNSPPSFKNALLNLNNYPEYKRDYVTLDDNTYALYSGDSSPTVPPLEFSEYPKNQSIMYGGGNALTKSFKITVYQANSPIFEIDGVFGFAHALVELAGGNLNLESPNLSEHPLIKQIRQNPNVFGNLGNQVVNLISLGDAIQMQNLTTQGYEELRFAWENKPVWKLVRCVIKDYSYIPINLQLENLFSVVNDDGSLTKVTLPEDFAEKFNRSNYSVLSRIVSRGYELRRFNEETVSNAGVSSSVNAYNRFQATSTAIADRLSREAQLVNAVDNLDAVNWITGRFLLESFLYRKVPIVECVDYGYAPYGVFYKDEQFTDQFTTTLIRKSDLNMGDDSQFLTVIVPDPNWKPRIMQTEEHTYKRSISIQGNPNWLPTARNYFASNPTVIYTGTEEESYVTYQPMPSFNTTDAVIQNPTIFNTLNSVKQRMGVDVNRPAIEFPRKGLKALAESENDGYTITEGFYESLFNSINSIPTAVPRDLYKNLDKDFDFYMSRIKTRTASNQGYKDGALFENYEVIVGRPPELPTKKNTVDLRENRDPLYSTEFFHYVTSDIQTQNLVSKYSNALTNNVQELVQAATNYLIHEHLVSGNTVSISIDPKQRVGILNSGMVEVAGNWVVIKYKKKTTKFGNNFTFSSSTDVVFGDLKTANLSLRIINKLNRNVKYSNLERSGMIFINPEILNRITKNAVDVTAEFSQKGFGRFISLNNPAKVDPVALIDRLKTMPER